MPLDFPSNPIDGQIYGNYIWSSSAGAWKSKPTVGSITVQSPTAPTSANAGDVWINTNDGTAFSYMNDGTSFQWVEIISSGVPNINIVMPTGSIIQTALPSAPDGWLLCQGQEVLISSYQNLYNAITVMGTVFNYGSNTNGSGAAGSTHFRLPNLQGRVPVGKNSGTFATLGSSGGAETVALTEANIPSHTHTFSGTTGGESGHTHTAYGISTPTGSGSGYLGLQSDSNLVWYRGNGTNWASGGGAGGSIPAINVGGNMSTSTSGSTGHTHGFSGTTSTGSGSGTAHNNLQPYIVLNYMIKV